MKGGLEVEMASMRPVSPAMLRALRYLAGETGGREAWEMPGRILSPTLYALSDRGLAKSRLVTRPKRVVWEATAAGRAMVQPKVVGGR